MKKKKTPKKEIEGLTTLVIDEAAYSTLSHKKHAGRKPFAPRDPRLITSFMPGTIQEVFVAEGDAVTAGTQLCILEAMKMKNQIMAPFDGVIKKLNVQSGQMVAKNYVLVELE